MTSPLADLYNTILLIPGAETQGTDEVGNTILIPGPETEYRAFLKKSRDPQLGYAPGTNSLKQYFKGYVVEPEQLPPGFNLPATVKCRKRRGQADQWVDGTFEILPVFKAVDMVEDVLGDAIEGYFTIQK